MLTAAAVVGFNVVRARSPATQLSGIFVFHFVGTTPAETSQRTSRAKRDRMFVLQYVRTSFGFGTYDKGGTLRERRWEDAWGMDVLRARPRKWICATCAA